MILDYSQYSTFLFCPWLWYEKYIQGLAPNYQGRQRSDPLALGSLVHAGLDHQSKTGKIHIPEEVITEVTPTRECLDLAELLIRGYFLRYPREYWDMELTEEPVKFPLWDEINGVAKLDKYFYVPTDTTIDSGTPGHTLTLARGWWTKEYKTKSPGVDRGDFIAEWAAKRQADFQLLALHTMVNSREFGEKILKVMDRYGNVTSQVQGVLVSVLEKPREYTPKRKCKGCGDSYALESYLPTSEGFMCPVCGHVQKLKPYIAKEGPKCDYFQFTVTRTPDQLAVAKGEILQIAQEMEEIREEGKESRAPNRDNCISNKWHKKCVFAESHIAGVEPLTEGGQYVKIDPYKYIGLPII